MKGQRFIPLVIVAAGLLAYYNSFTGSFFWGDVGSILENPTIRHLWPIWEPLSPPHDSPIPSGLTVEGRPLINLSLAVNYALSGYNVWSYHALNLTVHILAGLTLLGIVRRTLLQPALRNRFGAAANELALATAVLWTVHPLQTESVTYIIQRAESITGLFYLLTMYCFIRGVESPVPRLWYGLCVTTCALGMASKEVMVTAPVMVLLYDRAFLSGSFREVWRRHWPLYLALGSTWILLGLVLVSAGNFATALKYARQIGLSWWEYLATQPGVILYYLRLSAWPSPLRLAREWPIARTWLSILPPTVVIVILLGASVWAWRKRPAWGFLGAWFFLILAPSSSFIPLHDSIYEHRMYLSLAAVVSLVVLGLYSLAGRRSLAVFVAVAIGFGFLTWRRNQDYRRNPHYSLGFALQRAGRVEEAIGQYKLALQITPGDAWAHYNLAIALKDAGRVPEAIDQWLEAVRIDPNIAEAHANLGAAFAGLGRVSEAIGQYEQALRLKPNLAETHYNLGIALTRLGRVPEAIGHWEQALQINPDYAEAHYNLGVAFTQLGRLPEAIRHWEQALRIKPDYAEVHGNLAVVLERTGRGQEAIAHYEEALRLKPDDAKTHYNFGLTLWRVGEVEAAVQHWEQAVRIKPDYTDAHNNLGGALLQLGRVQEAIAHLEQALRIAPDMAEAHYNLAVALEQTGRMDEAIKQYEQVLRLKPDYAEAQQKLARLRAAP